ncbi:serine/threonine-protein kinase [Actinomadura scrupuli]|uniref:serine/threonine-protein kinase n=1 Tax=Actinomadura scrupuli TaxID=559629 RepID=UPI003D968DC4
MAGAITPEAHPLRPGDPAYLGAYEVVGRLGEGGQGSVFLARRAGDPEFRAIKLLHTGLTSDPRARTRFVRELEVAKLVARFCTAQVLDADVAGDRPYIVSEYVAGRSLHSLVREEGPRAGGALERLAIGTLTALAAIHQAGIVHRDFKPQNVMLGSDGPRVIDFGVARALDAAGETQNVGTPSYMAPENFDGRPIGPPVDLFAWGSTMVFAATGLPAFGNDEIGEVMHRILHAEPDLGAFPSPLREVVAACLSKDPDQRPTAREAHERLLDTAPSAPALTTAPLAAAPTTVAASSAPPAVAAPAAAVPPPGPAPMPAPMPASMPLTVPGGMPRAGRRFPVLPLLAGAIVATLLLAVPVVWATVRGDGDRPAGTAAEATPGPEAQGNGNTAGGTTTGGHDGQSGSGKKGGAVATPGSTATRSPATAGTPQARPTGAAGGRPGSGGGETPPVVKNPYTPEQVCNSGGHGSGYYRQRSSSFSGGSVHQLYNGSGYNCVVTLKTVSVGKKTSVWATLTRKDGQSATDSGAFAYYAGPVYLYAKGQCVKYRGGAGQASASVSWANCG